LMGWSLVLMGCPVIVDRLGLSTMWRGRARRGA
jgi:hypothetical protein